MKTISDVQLDAVMLHGLAQGVVELYDLIETKPGGAASSMPAILESLMERAGRLSDDLEEMERLERQRGAA